MGPRSAIGLIGALAAGVGAVIACGDAELPTYTVHGPILRVIPDRRVLSEDQDTVFVVVELTAQEWLAPRTLYVRAEGAQSVALPGPSYCGSSDAGVEPSAGDTPDAGSGDGGSQGRADGGARVIGPAEIVIPHIALRSDEQRKLHETAVVLNVPRGTGDVVVVAAAYRANSATACVRADAQLEAFAFARIERQRPYAPDAGTPSATPDAGMPGQSDAGVGDGGSGAADAGTGSRTDGGVVDGGIDAGMDAGADSRDGG